MFATPLRAADEPGQPKSKQPRRSRRGAATVELAATAPLLFLITFGMVEVGRALMVQQLLGNAARDGARSATLEGASVASVETAVSDYLASSRIENPQVFVTPNPLTLAQGGDPVTVTVRAPLASNSWVPSWGFMKNLSLDSSVTMRREVFTAPPDEG